VNLLNDLRYAARILLKARLANLVCILTLAIGIGSNIAIFSLLNAVLLRPLPFPGSRRLIAVAQIDRREGHPTYTSMPDFLRYEKEADTFQSLAAFDVTSFGLKSEDGPEIVEGSLVTRHFFSTLGITAAKGRTFSAEDADGTLVISYPLWQSRFHGDPSVIGKQVFADGLPAAIIGVMPQGFWFPESKCQMWRLITAESSLVRANPDLHFLRVFGSLKVAGDLQQTIAQLNLINEQLMAIHPDLNSNLGITTSLLAEDLVKNVKSSLLILMVAVAFVLIIGCANVAHYQLSRLLHRSKEFSIRLALGASRARVFAQLFMESLVLSVFGGILGLLFAFAGIQLAIKLIPTAMPRASEVRLDLPVIAFTLAVCLLAGVLSAVIPCLQLLGSNFTRSLHEQGERGTVGKRTRLLQHVLIVAEVATAFALLVGVNLMMRSFLRLSAVDIGFNKDRLLTVTVHLPRTNYSNLSDLEIIRTRIYERISEIPGVQAVSACSDLPLVGGFANYYLVKGEPERAPADREIVAQASVSPGYFEMMSIPLVYGREFSRFDTANSQYVAVINESMARRLMSAQTPLDSQIRHGLPEELTRWYTVVGVVKDTVPLLGWQPMPKIFTAFSQVPVGYDDILARPLTLLVRTKSRNAVSIAASVQAAIVQLDPAAGSQIRPVDEIISTSLSEPRFRTVLVSIFGAVAFGVSIIGIYGVVSTATMSETKNIGIRMSLGASPRDVLAMIVRREMAVTLAGLVLGTMLSLVLMRLFQSLFYEVSASDPAAFATAAVTLAMAALAAIWFPANRAARVDPVVALRHQ
jgi:putative ABC transport system permease protein